MNTKLNNSTELVDTLIEIGSWTLSTVLGAVFLALWIATQWSLNNFIAGPLELTGIDKIVLTIFQVLFALATLAPVVFTIYRNIMVMWLRTKKKINLAITMLHIPHSFRLLQKCEEFLV